MPSTFTANYGLELITTGEQQGTWGLTTNQTYKRLEQIFGGSAVITVESGEIPSNSALTPADAPTPTILNWVTTRTAPAGEANSEGRAPFVTFECTTDYSELGLRVNILGTDDNEHPDRLFIVKNSLSDEADMFLRSNDGADFTLKNGLSAFVATNGVEKTVTNVLENIELSSVDFDSAATGEIILDASNAAALVLKDSAGVAYQTFNTSGGKISLGKELELASGTDLATTGAGTITAAGGLTVDAGGIALDGGNLVVNPGNVTVAAGEVTVTAGDVIVTAGGLQLKEGSDISPKSDDHGVLYTKDVSSATELFFDNNTGDAVQITPGFLTGLLSPVTTGSLITPVIIGQRFFDTNNRGWWTAFGLAEGNWTADIAPGTIWIFAGPTAPEGWLLCDGVPPGSGADGTALEDLFSAIGNTYGGDDATDFDIPDIKGRVVAGKESSELLLTTAISGIDGGDLGAAGGSEKLQSHTHNYVKVLGTITDAEGKPDDFFEAFTVTTATSEHNQPVGESGNVQPTIILNYMIKK